MTNARRNTEKNIMSLESIKKLFTQDRSCRAKKRVFSSFYQSLALSQLCITLLHSSHIFCFAASADGTILSITKNIEQIMGQNPEEMIGKSALSYLHKEDIFSVYKFFKNSQKKGSEEHCVVRVKSENENWITIKLFSIWNHSLQHNPHYVGVLIS